MMLMLTLAPFLMVGGGALLLMLVEVTSKTRGGLALGATLILVAGGLAHWAGAELAVEYGIRDDGDRQPPSYRDLHGIHPIRQFTRVLR